MKLNYAKKLHVYRKSRVPVIKKFVPQLIIFLKHKLSEIFNKNLVLIRWTT